MQKLHDLFRDLFWAHKKETILGAILFLIASLSFGLGFLTNREFNHAPIIIEKCSSISTAQN